jgi:hypothetical protein
MLIETLKMTNEQIKGLREDIKENSEVVKTHGEKLVNVETKLDNQNKDIKDIKGWQNTHITKTHETINKDYKNILKWIIRLLCTLVFGIFSIIISMNLAKLKELIFS